MLMSEERKKLKTRVDAVGRLTVAELVGMRYQTLSGKLSGYSSFTEEEIGKVNETITHLECVTNKHGKGC